MAIVTISRQIGSLGDEIAKALADKLGYEYMEKSKISEVLTKLGFSVSDVEIYDEKKTLHLANPFHTEQKVFPFNSGRCL